MDRRNPEKHINYTPILISAAVGGYIGWEFWAPLLNFTGIFRVLVAGGTAATAVTLTETKEIESILPGIKPYLGPGSASDITDVVILYGLQYGLNDYLSGSSEIIRYLVSSGVPGITLEAMRGR